MIALRCCFCCAKNELIPSLWSLPRPHPQSQALCASHGPYWLASLHVRGCVWQCQCPSSSHPSYPCPQIPSLHLHLYFCPENRLIGASFFRFHVQEKNKCDILMHASAHFLKMFFNFILVMYSFIFGCTGSSLLCVAFLQLQCADMSLW